MSRAKLSDATKSNNRLFFPYTYSGEQRTDTISNQYYGNPGYTWLIWFANETIDPYYDVALSEYDLEQLIVTKYGSREIAQRKILHYKINWETDDRVISIATFNSLQSGVQKYWEPVLDYNLNVKGYTRKREDQKLNTNRMGTLTVTSNTGAFIIGEEIQQVGDSTNYGFCTYTDTSNITLQHLQGAFDAGATVVGKESNAQAVIATANNFAATSAAYENSSYWTPVTCYEYEIDLNEKKKEIVLLDAMQAGRAEQDLIRIMNEQ
jgi:hypothetical protein